MDLKRIFIATFAVLTLFSCSKSTQTKQEDNYSLALSITARPMGRSIENPTVIQDIDIKLITMEIYDAGKIKISSSDITDATLIAAITNPKTQLTDKSRIVINNITDKAEYVKIIIYQTNTEIITDLSGSINNLQKPLVAVPFTAISGGVNNPLIEGDLIKINKTAYPASEISIETGRKIWCVEATLAPALARFEIMGNVKAQSVNLSSYTGAWADIVVTAVYMNNLRNIGNSNDIKLIAGNQANWGEGYWETGHPYTKPNGIWSNMFDGDITLSASNNGLFTGTNSDKAASYTVFPQGTKANSATYEKNEVPHIILGLKVTPKVSIYPPYYSMEPYYSFITLTKFKIDENGTLTTNYLNKVERGKIYRIDLSSITIKPGDGDPFPEQEKIDLHVKVTIQDWTTIILKPNL